MKKLIPLLLIVFLLAGCAQGNTLEKETQTVYAMDTVMTLTAYVPENGSSAAAAGLEAAEATLHRLDALLSVSQPSSEIYQLNWSGRGSLSNEASIVVNDALMAASATDGAYDPTVYPLMELWGFPTQEYHVPTQAELDAVLPSVGWEQVTTENGHTYGDHGDLTMIYSLPEGGGIDLGGIAKGYAGEKVMEELQAAGVTSAVISLGGNVGTLGDKPDGEKWTIAIEDPEKNGDYLGKVLLSGSFFVVTSGGYERYFEENGTRYHHILDPKTGYPAESDLESVTIISKDGSLADAYSTALFVMGKDKAIEFWRNYRDFEMVLYDGTTLYRTPGGSTPGFFLETELPVEEIQ